MFKLFCDKRGAVTIMVTLLLIPSILITGTGVDIARIYAANSMIHNANVLAANSMLASYDKVLKDLYGLYAVMEKDDEIAEMVDKYIKASVFGEDDGEAELGDFNLFAGSSIASTDSGKKMTLSESRVISRQIEEYSKLRAPVIIVTNIIDLLGAEGPFSKIKKDASVIEKKVDIDSEILDLIDSFREIYKRVKYNDNTYKAFDEKIIAEINLRMNNIKVAFKGDSSAPSDSLERKTLKALYSEWKDLKEEYDEVSEEIADLYAAGNEEGDPDVAAQYQSLVDRLSEISDDMDDIEDVYNPRLNLIKGTASTLRDKIETFKSHSAFHLGEYYDRNDALCLYSLKLNVEELKSKCASVDDKADSTRQKLNDLEAELSSGECSEELSSNMHESLDEYRSWLQYETYPMANGLTSNIAYIDNYMSWLDGVQYGTVGSSNTVSSGYSLSVLMGLSSLDDIDIEDDDEYVDILTVSSAVGNCSFGYHYNNTSPEWKLFKELSSEANELYLRMQEWFEANDSEDKEKEIKNKLNDFLEQNELEDEEPEEAEDDVNKRGAKKIPDNIFALLPSQSVGDNTPDIITNSSNADQAQRNSVTNVRNIGDFFGDLLNQGVNKVLILTYDTEMFSTYTTGKADPKITDEDEKNEYIENTKLMMSGATMGTDLNFLYRSEVEYLFKGKQNGDDNLAAVRNLIYAVRLVFNYISTFIIDEVRSMLTDIKLAIPAPPGLGVVISELARVVWAAVESAIDVKTLRNGGKVPLIKLEAEDWATSLSGLMSSVVNSVSDEGQGETNRDNIELSYNDYLRIFLLFVDGETIAKRTADLISLNMTNKYEDINADETQMGSAELFPMNKAYTYFDVTTEVKLKFIFLSLPFAQNKDWVSVVPPKSYPLKLTDYRGY